MRLIDADALMEALGITDMDCDKCEWQSGYGSYCSRGSDFTDACTAIEDAPTIEPQRWIPVTERLPEEKREVLVSTKDGYLNIAFLETLSTGDLEWTDVIEYFQIPNVAAWMPLPEPYKGRRTDG